MANDIVTSENKTGSLRLLLTQKYLYGRAKLVSGSQVILVVIAPGALVVFEQLYPPVRVWAALYGLVIALIDVALLDTLKTGLKQRAAAVQEWFDCDVLRLPWSDLKGGDKPDREDIMLADESDTRLQPLRNWYGQDVADVSEHVGRIICQRSNCWWDSKLRRLYRAVILIGATVLVVLMTATAVAQNRTLNDFILGFAPALPVIFWSVREAKAQAEAADRADRLKKFTDGLWASTLAQSVDSQAALTKSRELQDEILTHRRQSPLIFDWFYRIFRDRLEQKMVTSVAEMVGEAKAKGL